MKYVKLLLILSLLAFGLGVATVSGIYFYIKPELPSVDVLKDVRLQTPMRIYTQDGKLISQFGVKRRIPLQLENVPDQLVHAVLATEDSRFYEHPGIDPIGMMRAFVNLVVTGEKGQGGSTLTMQLARGFFLTRDKTYIRKIKEIFIAWHMEGLLTKEEILELYLNKIELGHRAFGFGAAAQVYYGQDISELTLAQLATLAGLPKAPSTLNPISRPERSVERRRVVLLRMLDEQFITRSQFTQAANAPVTAEKHGAEIELDAPYLADHIYNEMIEIYGKEQAETGGYRVYATVPSNLQKAAQDAVRQNLHDYDERHGYRGPLGQLWEPVTLEEGQDPDLMVSTIDNPAWTEAQMAEHLQKIVPIDPLLPAIVTKVDEKSMMVFDRDGEYRYIDWEGLMWARKYVDDNRQGPDPKTVADILTEGALVYVRQRDNGIWQLSQFPRASGALVALDPNNGAARAVVGGYSFYQSQFNRATQAKRQVGSNIKPFVYSAALEEGYTIASVINDAPINQWDASTGVAWRPQNSPAIYDGPIRMRIALGKSKNVVSVRLLRAVGIDDTVEYLTRFGFERSEIPRDETLSLGSGSHTPLEVVNGLATIANGGFNVQPHFIERIEDEQGNLVWTASMPVACDSCQLTAQVENQEQDLESLLAEELNVLPESEEEEEPKPQAERVISEQNAFLVKEMMRTAVRGNGRWNDDEKLSTYWLGTGWRARNILQRTDLAGKTGTTNDSRDAWFSGFGPGLVATSWVGFDDMSRMLGRATRNQNLINRDPEKFNWIGNAMIGAEDGAKAAQPAWIRFMEVALEGVPEQSKPIPENIVTVRIDRATGKLSKRTDYTSMFEYFVSGTEPTTFVEASELLDPFESQEQKEDDDIF